MDSNYKDFPKLFGKSCFCHLLEAVRKDISLFVALYLQLFPSPVHFLLERCDQLFVSGLEQVPEAALGAQEVLDGQLFLGLIG